MRNGRSNTLIRHYINVANGASVLSNVSALLDVVNTLLAIAC
jgi:hypothetical protein